jgi:hypothetical protein
MADVVCPRRCIGKRRLERALSLSGHRQAVKAAHVENVPGDRWISKARRDLLK